MPPWLVQKTKGGLKGRLFLLPDYRAFAVQLKKLNRPP